MTSRNTSFAHQLDRSAAKTVRSASPANSNKVPSPHSSRASFDTAKSQTLQAKAAKITRKTEKEFGPAPERSPQPRGMGAHSVNWQAHIKRAEALRDKVEGVKIQPRKPPAQLLDKAKKAARNSRATSPSFDRSASNPVMSYS